VSSRWIWDVANLAAAMQEVSSQAGTAAAAVECRRGPDIALHRARIARPVRPTLEVRRHPRSCPQAVL
jgi:hypothetical protein